MEHNINWHGWLDFADRLAKEVGQQLLMDFGNASAEQKADGSVVTNSDRWADNYIKTAINKEYPHHGVLTEESALIFPDRDWCWIIDPIDGTTNFARGIPIWAISLGLLYRGVPVFGYVHLPTLGQSFHGWFSEPELTPELAVEVPNSAAFLNGQPIAIETQLPADTTINNYFFSSCSRSLAAMGRAEYPFKLRMLGVATYNLLTVATGATLAAVEATPKIWDIAAVWVILQAAGAQWISLNKDTPIFPLQPNQDYGDRSFPSLVVGQRNFLPTFLSLVEPLAN
ncbi:inositol monophosphatase [Thalassoporum mexicanum PCC 7367]|uniref:inositol monophosphatase family protein n=1 Tax=Thalassoporum mexicanum TaxID=3457544 RepID=UPI00029FF2A3|nr:inositol monophosphatase family protein [Pseudanabaena sp. PCC 7367]AFY68782.1 inositol monophosphatase [Pseudanabaena sp. PCC 7367]